MKNKLLLSVLFFSLFTILSSFFSVYANQKDQVEAKGYIVTFKEKPLAKIKEALTQKGEKATIVVKELEKKKQALEKDNIKAKEDIVKRLKRDPVTNEYTGAINAVAASITEQEAQKLKKESPYVKDVYPNLKIKATLMDSVQQIKADIVWQTQDSKGQNITGKDIRIAVIDTGVDYYHNDLGGVTSGERLFQKITNQPVPTDTLIDINQSMSIANSTLAYAEKNNIHLYNFTTKDEYIASNSALSHIRRLVYKDNFIAYFGADANSKGAIYLYDTQTDIHKKIVDTQEIGTISLANNKIVYSRQRKPGENTNIFIYDIASAQEIPTKDNIYDTNARANGNFIAYTVSGNACFDKAVIYDINTHTSRDINPTDIGDILDFKDDTILYLACSKTAFDPTASTYYLYNITTGITTKLHHGAPYFGTSTSQEVNKKVDYYTINGRINVGFIEGDLVHTTKSLGTQRIITFDNTLNRSVQINRTTPSFDFAAEGKRICFYSKDFNIYCHLYDPTNSYSAAVFASATFNQKVVDGYNFIDNTNNPFDDNGHGTHVASIVAGKGTFEGVAKDAKIVAYKVLNASGVGYFSDIIAAINMAIQTRFDADTSNDIDVINLSLGADCKAYFGGYTPVCGPDDILSQAVDNAVASGITVVVAAGNSGPENGTINTPGTARKAITVGAVNKSLVIASFSAKGPVLYNGETIQKPEIVAPGVDICAAKSISTTLFGVDCFDNAHYSLSGTSMAAPHVAGAAALLKQANPLWNPDDIRNAFTTTARNIGYDANTQGSGFINVLAALYATPSATPTPTPTPIPVILSDSFTDNANKPLQDHIPDIGGAWVRLNNISGFRISDNNRLRAEANNWSAYFNTATPSANQYIVAADFYVASLQGVTGIIARSDSKNANNYSVAYNTDRKQWEIAKKINGRTIILGKIEQFLTVGSTYSVKFVVSNSAKQLFIKGPSDSDYALRFSTSDNTNTVSGLIGIVANPNGLGKNTVGIHLDNLLVTPL